MSKSKTTTDQPRYFGTDGIRATFGEPPLDEPNVRRIARVLAATLHDDPNGASHAGTPHVVLGGDTRASTPILVGWLAAELRAAGVGLTYLGIVPTPAIAERTRSLGASCGIAISASHNPHADNGIKLIDKDGFKWSAADEIALEKRLGDFPLEALPAPAIELPVEGTATDSYLEAMVRSLGDDAALAGLSIALDTGNGAASHIARPLFEKLGARVHLVAADPDGYNINAGCGSTFPKVLSELTRSTGSDLGFSFDGDADRVILADENGDVRDGDAILYLWALFLANRDELPHRRLVATSMSNLGLEAALERHGIGIERCDVGDREVVATMRREGLMLGGEQSGHVIHLGLSTTGDGLLTALHLASLIRTNGRPVSQQLVEFVRFPQLLENVKVRHKPPWADVPRIEEARDAVSRQLGDRGRIVLRYSGTEPLARIMIEGPDRAMIEAMAGDLATVIAEELS